MRLEHPKPLCSTWPSASHRGSAWSASWRARVSRKWWPWSNHRVHGGEPSDVQTRFVSYWTVDSTKAFNDRCCIITGDTTLMSVEDTTASCGFFSCSSVGCNGGKLAEEIDDLTSDVIEHGTVSLSRQTWLPDAS